MKRIGSVWIAVGALGIASCGGGVAVGTEPGAGGAGGTTSSGSGGKAGTGGAGGATGGSAGQAGSGVAGAGGSTVMPTSRCNFMPETTGAGSGPVGSGATVLARIALFLENAPPDPNAAPPAQASATWASTEATAMLDHENTTRVAPGLSQFLETSFNIPRPMGGAAAFFADAWSAKLVAPDATLATLLAGAAADPRRHGILADAQVLTRLSTISQRGAWMNTNLACAGVPPSPPGVAFPVITPLPNETRRQILARRVAGPTCMSCHVFLDPPGWSLEHFDAMGAYGDADNGTPVDSSGTMRVVGNAAGTPETQLTFTSIDDLGPQLATSCAVAACFTRTMMSRAFNVATGATPPYTDAEVNHVANRFADAGFSIRELVKGIVETPSFLK